MNSTGQTQIRKQEKESKEILCVSHQESILEKDNENSNGEVKIVFKNDFMIPYKINIKDKNTGTTTEIQLNDTVNSNNKEGE